jgi:hypothetical protein
MFDGINMFVALDHNLGNLQDRKSMFLRTYQTIRCHNPEHHNMDWKFCSYDCPSGKSYIPTSTIRQQNVYVSSIGQSATRKVTAFKHLFKIHATLGIIKARLCTNHPSILKEGVLFASVPITTNTQCHSFSSLSDHIIKINPSSTFIR